MTGRRHQHRERRRLSLLPLALVGGAVAVALVLPAAPLDEPAPESASRAAPAGAPTSTPATPERPTYRVIPRLPCPPGEQSYTVVATDQRTEWLCVRVTPPQP